MTGEHSGKRRPHLGACETVLRAVQPAGDRRTAVVPGKIAGVPPQNLVSRAGGSCYLPAMSETLHRRAFLGVCTSSLAGLAFGASRAHAIEPFPRVPPARLQLSLAAYSFREFFKDTTASRKTPPPADQQLDLLGFVDYCAAHGCVGTELTSYYFPKEVTPEFLVRLRRHAFLRGVAVSGTSVGNTFTLPPGPKRDEQIALVKRWTDHAAVLGAPHIRIFAGAAPKEVPKAEAQKLCIAAIEECADYAGGKGIFLGLENHGGIVAEAADLLDIIRAVKSPWVGINLDTGNFHSDDPYRDLAECAPYAVNVQVKVEIKRRGQARSEPADLSRLVKLLREANYQGFVALEYEAAENPWKAVPVWLQRMKEAFAT